MNGKRMIAFGGIVALLAVSFAGNAWAYGRCVCPQVYAPVECSNGKTYPNQCVADCRRAKDCVPIGVLATETATDAEAPANPWLEGDAEVPATCEAPEAEATTPRPAPETAPEV